MRNKTQLWYSNCNKGGAVMKIIFIRHGKTPGNLKKQYIGITDESLTEQGIYELKCRNYPDCDIVVSSPMKRCIETAKIVYPSKKIIINQGLRECNFGNFECKSYEELKSNSDYIKWIESGGVISFPNGESRNAFSKRCTEAFASSIKGLNRDITVSFIIHGGTIMAILEKYAFPKKSFYDFQVQGGGGFITDYNGMKISILENL